MPVGYASMRRVGGSLVLSARVRNKGPRGAGYKSSFFLSLVMFESMARLQKSASEYSTLLSAGLF